VGPVALNQFDELPTLIEVFGQQAKRGRTSHAHLKTTPLRTTLMSFRQRGVYTMCSRRQNRGVHTGNMFLFAVYGPQTNHDLLDAGSLVHPWLIFYLIHGDILPNAKYSILF